MRAFASLCARRPDLDLRLDVVGAIHHAVADEVEGLAASEKRIGLHEYLPDDAVWDLVSGSHATVFMSLYEGFGLPIAESLWLGTPCMCSDHGSMIEIASAGGCLTVPAADATAIEQGFERLADDPSFRSRLAHEARTRTLRSWRDYGNDVLAALVAAPTVQRVVVIETDGDDGHATAETLRRRARPCG